MRAPSLRTILSAPPGRRYYGDGLVLIVRSKARRSWAFRYTKKSTHRPTETSIGSAFAFTYYEARNEIANMRRLLAQGIDPVQAKRQQRAAGKTFAEACDGWINQHKSKWRSLRHTKLLIGKHGKPLADQPVGLITPDMIVKALSGLLKHHPEQARRALSMWARVFDYAKVMGYRSGDNPATWRGNMEHIFPARAKGNDTHYASMPFKEVPAFVGRLRLRQVKSHSASALEFQILTAARPGEVLNMKWSEVDLVNRIWTLPPERTKQNRQHRVPLSERCMAILALQNEYRTGDFVFSGYRGVALDPKALRVLLRNMDIRVTAHGFRSSFRNWAFHTRQDRDLAELSLGHLIAGKTEGAYLTDDGLEERRPIMDAWAKFIS